MENSQLVNIMRETDREKKGKACSEENTKSVFEQSSHKQFEGVTYGANHPSLKKTSTELALYQQECCQL